MRLFKTATQKRIAAQEKASKENAKRTAKFNAEFVERGVDGLIAMCQTAPIGKTVFQPAGRKRSDRPCKHFRYLQRYK